MALTNLRTLPVIVRCSNYSNNSAIQTIVCRKLLIANPTYCLIRHNQTHRDPNKWLYKRLWATSSLQWTKTMKSIDTICTEHTQKATRMAKELVNESSLAMESESYTTRYKDLMRSKSREYHQKLIQPKFVLLKENYNYALCASKCYIQNYGAPIRNVLLTILCIARDYSLRIGNSAWFQRLIGFVRKMVLDLFDLIRNWLTKRKFLKDNPKDAK